MERINKGILFLIGLVVIAGCIDPQLSSPSADGIYQSPSPSFLVTVSKAMTPISTATTMSSEVPALVTTNHPTNTQKPTFTLLPSLAPALVDERVQVLMKDNAGCRFPCWWGITPGETPWIEASHFLESFTEITSYANRDFDGKPTGVITYSIMYPLLTNQGEMMTGFEAIVENGQISIVAVGSGNQIDATLLHKLLSDYGPPGQIYLHTSDRVPEGYDIPLRLVLYYPDQHFLARYEFIAREDPGNLDSLVSCFTAENPALYFWSPEEVVTEQRVQDWTIGVDPFIPLKPLDQVTDLDIASFTEVFSTGSDEGNCIRTRKEFWDGKS